MFKLRRPMPSLEGSTLSAPQRQHAVLLQPLSKVGIDQFSRQDHVIANTVLPLPPEIRNRIYKILLYSHFHPHDPLHSSVILHPNDLVARVIIAAPITHVNRHIRAEVRSLWLPLIRWELDFTSRRTRQALCKWLKTLSTIDFQCLRYINLHIPPPDCIPSGDCLIHSDTKHCQLFSINLGTQPNPPELPTDARCVTDLHPDLTDQEEEVVLSLTTVVSRAASKFMRKQSVGAAKGNDFLQMLNTILWAAAFKLHYREKWRRKGEEMRDKLGGFAIWLRQPGQYWPHFKGARWSSGSSPLFPWLQFFARSLCTI